ncbi:GNAT family N-acetyltransferase [Iamia sp. SCSIO 61187]|nr:GNAT family N-acetyltransferase [Iamia sp. SCSIO 61187]
MVPASQAADPNLRAQLLRVWVEVTNAGGSVGFAAPAPVDQVAATLDTALQHVASGRDALGVLRDGSGEAVGMGLLVARGVDLFAHWRTVLRLMVHPDHQGAGGGRALVEGLHRLGRDLGLEHLHLSVRGGEGLEPFYERFGYRVVGTHPGAVRLAPDDTRDEVFMVAVL